MTTPVTEELPPRARRILNNRRQQFGNQGTTSACAENTGRVGGFVSAGRNYLRVRGEYTVGIAVVRVSEELPPRARRIQAAKVELWRQYGTTSACAENTSRFKRSIRSRWNYLRVRGEYLLPFCLGIIRMELPPRARRIRRSVPAPGKSPGTTSACAENTGGGLGWGGVLGNYLRVRGEYFAKPRAR